MYKRIWGLENFYLSGPQKKESELFAMPSNLPAFFQHLRRIAVAPYAKNWLHPTILYERWEPQRAFQIFLFQFHLAPCSR